MCVRTQRSSPPRPSCCVKHFLPSHAGSGRKVGHIVFNLRQGGGVMDSRVFVPSVLLLFGLVTVFAQSNSPNQVCESKNGTSCEECLKNVTCLWCITTKSCLTYPVRTILPPHALCPLNDARWGLCWMNFQTLIICLAVIGGIIIIAFFVCLFCCCKCENFGSNRFEAKMQRQANKLKTKQEERKAEMKQRHDEIRQKYGLSGPNPYSKFA
ncbi:PTTG1 interacting protein a isoform X1 [Takifugu rubripes]|uniref:Pituitary tumor-transforming gene 1 protein-interacting protein-like n=1 Tax=Takifugu rubripes TaxID=31033 RepID=A0A3B5KS54_TAKRU|nr:pituitary tumor-transforming gene 1 protein-interacting protein-like isoform X1 [Takifugu rubripes]|eukprot:XP_003962807.2 PREDICTED: pituitary tumor-transforming gene 1 protein-interacting protein-like [Takifugu rubripes]